MYNDKMIKSDVQEMFTPQRTGERMNLEAKWV